jgi:putative ABC transport system permease protein
VNRTASLGDTLRIGVLGLRTRRLRAILSGVGIAIGIASLVAVLGLSESSKANLVAALDRLGTNLLRVEPGQSFLGGQAKLPRPAARMIRRLPDVQAVAGVEALDTSVRRNDLVGSDETGGLQVLAADPSLVATLGGRVAAGEFLDGLSSSYPVVVLGAVAAYRLGITHWHRDLQVWIGNRPFTVVGVLATLPLAPDLDRAVFVGDAVARRLLHAAGSASTIYVRVDPDRVASVWSSLADTANPSDPEETAISRPSDALAARAAAKSAFTALFLGLGAVALVVGGIGIANVMVIAVLERRSEIGLRRALGASRVDIRLQFLTESLLLSLAGGTAGIALGSAATATFAVAHGWGLVIPLRAFGTGLGAAVAIGAAAGIYPAVRAARLSPTAALRSV